jgi:hypothetical protein
VKRFFRDNGLSIVSFVLFVVFLVGMSLTGLRELNHEREDHGEPPASYGEYLTSGEFLEITMENWESEFLQMALYVILTAFLFQRGSAESKDPDKSEPVDRDPRTSKDPNAPWPVKRGGLVLKLYENSLSIAFALLFLASLLLHARGGAIAWNDEQLSHGSSEMTTTFGYMTRSRFWYESFQNWQSEFLAVFAIVFLTIFLRQRASPESKPVDAPHDQTGD